MRWFADSGDSGPNRWTLWPLVIGLVLTLAMLQSLNAQQTNGSEARAEYRIGHLDVLTLELAHDTSPSISQVDCSGLI